MEFTKKNTLQLKGIAIILMLMHHCFLSNTMYGSYNMSFAPFSEGTINHISWFGKVCVSIFAFLSGYGLALSYDNKKETSIFSWYTKRFGSLYKGYWFVFVLSFIICNVWNRLPWNIYFGNGNYYLGVMYVLLDFLGISNFFGTPSMNGAWWYMSAAIMIIFVTPLVHLLYKKIKGIPLLVLSILVPRAFGIAFQGNNSYMAFLFVSVCGAVFAYGNWMVRCREWHLVKNIYVSSVIKFVIMAVLLYVGYHAFMTYPVESFYELDYGIIPVLLILFCYEFVIQIPVVKQILEFIGKHATNIFYVHIFIRSYYATDFIFSFRHFSVTILVLLMMSLGVSVLMELFKKLIRYEKWFDQAWNALLNKKRTERSIIE